MKQDLVLRIQAILSNPDTDEAEMLHQLRNLNHDSSNQNIETNEAKTIAELFAESKDNIQKSNGKSNIVNTGFYTLDNAIGGFSLGEFVVVGGRPSMGKTLFLVSLTKNISESIPVLYFTFDLSDYLLANRFISSITGIAVNKILQDDLTADDKSKFFSIDKQISNHKLFISDSGNGSITSLKAQCEKQIKEHGVKVIIVDFLQMMSTNRYRNSRELEIGFICRELKNIAKDNNVCVIASSQLNRAVETRGGNKRPQLSDLRDSGSIEQDADKVIFIHRPEYFGFLEDEEGNNLKGVAEIIIAKNRNGKTTSVSLIRDENFTEFKDNNASQCIFLFSKNRLDELDIPY